jgi:hypothetical protein
MSVSGSSSETQSHPIELYKIYRVSTIMRHNHFNTRVHYSRLKNVSQTRPLKMKVVAICPSDDISSECKHIRRFLVITYIKKTHKFISLIFSFTKAKVVPLHATVALWWRGGIVPTHSRPRH